MLEPSNGRTQTGRFAPGHTLAAERRPFQYALRAEYLQSTLTSAQLLEFKHNPRLLDDRSIIDAQIIKRLIRTLADIEPTTCSDVERAMDSHLDRMLGKPAQTQNIDMNLKAQVTTVTLTDREIIEQYEKRKQQNAT